MRCLRQTLFRLGSLFRRRQIEAELFEEMRTHLDMATEANIAAGMSAEEARYAALRASGGVAQAQERVRDERGVRWLEELWRDGRLACRQLAKTPGYTAVALLSLALGIGANTAVFSLVNAVLLRSLPVPNPQELRLLHWSGDDQKIPNISGHFFRTIGSDISGYDAHQRVPGRRVLSDAFAYPVFGILREQVAPVAELVALAQLQSVTVRVRAESFVDQGLIVSGNFFSGLGVHPVLGRLFAAGDEAPGGDPIVVISWVWWEKYFNFGPGVLGQTVALNGRSFTVVGVLPREFRGESANSTAAFFVPVGAQPVLLPSASLTTTDHWWMQLMARVRSGTSAAQLQTALDAAFRGAAGAQMTAPRIEIEPGATGPDFACSYYREPLLILLGVVGAVILLACANLAGLSLARAASRRHECAVRAALGCGRWRLVRQSLTESLVLAGAGGMLGVVVALWGRTVLSRLLGVSGDFTLDHTVLGFTLVLTLVTALLAGLLPAWRAGQVDPLEGLKSGRACGRPHLRAGRLLVAVQIALSVLLVTGAGLYGRTLLNLVRIDPGFDTDHLLLVQLNPGVSGHRGVEGSQFYERVQEALATLPAVRNVTLSDIALLSGWSSNTSFEMPAHPQTSLDPDPKTWSVASSLTVGDKFFETLGLPVVQGRSFTPADGAEAPKVIVVNETLARKYFAGETPLGQVLRFGSDEWAVVGVCRDARYASIKEEVPAIAYFPFRQKPVDSAYLALRTALPPLSLVPAVRKAVAAIDPNVPLANVTTQETVRDEKISQERMFATLVGVLAGLAVLLACIGLYGLLAYNVARRMPEFGIRTALGARRGDIVVPIMCEALGLVVAGVAVGVPAAVALAQIIRSQLYGVVPADPLTLVAATLLLIGVAVLASWLPARRAARVDPLVALRAE